MYQLISSIRNLKIEESEKIFKLKPDDVFFYHLLNSGEMIQAEIFNKRYVAFVGASEFSRMIKNSIFYLKIEENQFDKKTMKILISNMTQIIEIFSVALWIIKDNSIWPSFSTIIFLNDDQFEIEILRRNNYVSDSKGSYKDTYYSELELNKAIKYFDMFLKTGKKLDRDSVILEDGYRNLSSSFTFDAPSFSRALLLLISARRADLLFAKISMYISTLECLLAVDGENTHKVSERVARFIGDGKMERHDIFQRMKKYYGIRSIYIHGSELKRSKHDGLEETSVKLDEFVRRTFKKLMDQYPQLNYNNKANVEETRLSREQVNDWFDELVLD